MSEEMMVGNYELRNCVASGSTTQIWEVAAQGSPMQLAMKLMLDEHRKNSAERAVLKHEFKIGRLMEHPAFLRFHEIEINRDHSFFVMDYFRSPSLKTHITGNLPAVQSALPKLVESLTMGFHFMHDIGWLHRDIKPDNILVNKAGESRIIDFSLSCRIASGLGKLFGKAKQIQGTRTYIAPETILKKKPTPQTDMYSLGVTLFEVLTGVPVFAGDSPNALLKKHLGEDPVAPSVFNDNVTKDVDRIILRMLEKNPAKRFESMQDLCQAFRSCRFFETDPLQQQEEKQAEIKRLAAESVDVRLDSRADADRTARGVKAPARVKKKPKINPRLLKEEEERKARERSGQGGAEVPAAQQPMMPGAMPPMGMPQMPFPQMPMPQQPMMPGVMPGMVPPGMPQPGMGMPGMPMPQQPMPGMVPPGMPPMMPGQPAPGYPPQQVPAQPGQPPAPAAPVQQPPPVAQQPPQQPAAPAPAARAEKTAEPEPASTEDMIDLMSQLDIE